MKRLIRTALALLVGSTLSCGGTEGRLEPRFVAVQNAMAAMGLAQTGAISEGSLPQGAEARIEMELDAGECYTFMALGSSQVADVDLQVLDAEGEEIGRDSSHDSQAAAHACPTTTGTHVLLLTMRDGQGSYTLTVWSGTQARGGAVARSGGGRGGASCAEPVALTPGRPVQGRTEGVGNLDGTCVRGGAPEQVYQLEVTARSQVSAVLQSSYDGALYLQRACGQQQSEIACNDDAPDTNRSQVDATLEPGTYFLVVDGYADEAGDFELIVSVSGLQSVAAVCDDAPPLPPGQRVSGTTAGTANYFQATCARGAQSPDRVYSLDVPSPSRLRVRQQSDHDGALHVRRTCNDPTSEVICNDDFGADERRSIVTTMVSAGRHYVYADGFGSDNSGNFTLIAELTAESGGGTSADQCSSPGAAAVGQQLGVDTFDARDDYAGSCGGGGAADQVFELQLAGRSRVRATINEAEFDGVMYLRSACDNDATEVSCEQFALFNPSTFTAEVPAGTYFLFVDGQSNAAFGSAQLNIVVDDLQALDRSCRRAPMIRAGRVITGDTRSESDRFHATCAGGAQSNDVVYRLRLARRQLVRINLTSTSDWDGALHLRRTCTDASTEIACNDDHNDNRHSFIETTLDAGMYFVVVDGFQTNNAGTYTLDVQTSAP